MLAVQADRGRAPGERLLDQRVEGDAAVDLLRLGPVHGAQRRDDPHEGARLYYYYYYYY